MFRERRVPDSLRRHMCMLTNADSLEHSFWETFQNSSGELQCDCSQKGLSTFCNKMHTLHALKCRISFCTFQIPQGHNGTTKMHRVTPQIHQCWPQLRYNAAAKQLVIFKKNMCFSFALKQFLITFNPSREHIRHFNSIITTTYLKRT